MVESRGLWTCVIGVCDRHFGIQRLRTQLSQLYQSQPLYCGVKAFELLLPIFLLCRINPFTDFDFVYGRRCLLSTSSLSHEEEEVVEVLVSDIYKLQLVSTLS